MRLGRKKEERKESPRGRASCERSGVEAEVNHDLDANTPVRHLHSAGTRRAARNGPPHPRASTSVRRVAFPVTRGLVVVVRPIAHGHAIVARQLIDGAGGQNPFIDDPAALYPTNKDDFALNWRAQCLDLGYTES